MVPAYAQESPILGTPIAPSAPLAGARVGEAPLPASPSQRYLPGGITFPGAGPPGFRLGDFIIRSGAATSLAYDDNVAARDEREGGLLWSGLLQTRAQSTFRRHALGFDAAATYSQGLVGTDTNNFNWRLGTDGRLDLTRRSRLSGRLSYSRVTADPEDAESEVTRNAQILSASGGYSRTFGLFTGAASGFITRTAEEDDGTTANELVRRRNFDPDLADDERLTSGDRTSYGILFPISYPATQRLSLNVTPSWRRTLYDDDGDRSDTQVFGSAIGAAYQVTGDLTLAVSVGLQFRLDDDGTTSFSPAEALTFDWSVTKPLGGRTLLSLDAAHNVADTSLPDAVVRRNTRLSAGITHLLSPDVGLQASLGFTRSDFVGVDRVDNTVAGQLGASWRINERFSLITSYRYSQRFSENGNDFYRNLVTLSLSTVF